jgi:hypothetical protein
MSVGTPEHGATEYRCSGERLTATMNEGGIEMERQGEHFSMDSDKFDQVTNLLVISGLDSNEAHWAAKNYLLDYDWPMAADHQANLGSMSERDLTEFVRDCARDDNERTEDEQE